MNICFVIATLTSGGAERVACNLCNCWSLAGHRITIITFEKDGAIPHYQLKKNVTLKQLDLLSLDHSTINYLKENIIRIVRLKREFHRIKPDLIISFMLTANILNIFATAHTGIPLIISERVHPGFHNFGKMREFLRLITYRYADRIVVQTEEISRWFMDSMNVKPFVIQNPVDLNYFVRKTADIKTEQKKYIVSAGRLDRQKGQDLLIEAFSDLHDQYPEWNILIYGEGPEHDNLKDLIKKLNLEDKVYLKGIIQDIRDAFDLAEIFVLSSRYEGYPNVLIEALAYNLCVIASDCPGATREILDNGKYGRLVENENIGQLAGALAELMSSDIKRNEYKSQARNAVLGLSVENISERWLSLIKNVH